MAVFLDLESGKDSNPFAAPLRATVTCHLSPYIEVTGDSWKNRPRARGEGKGLRLPFPLPLRLFGGKSSTVILRGDSSSLTAAKAGGHLSPSVTNCHPFASDS